MSLGSGTRLGPYEIVAPLGAGGMGEVYRARDTRLDRTVALKVVPPEFAADPDRRARFAREAKAVAAISHPHICALYDIGESVPSGPDEPAPSAQPLAAGPVRYLVMEYLEGETLAARLARAGARSRPSGPPTPPVSTPLGPPAPGPVRRGSGLRSTTRLDAEAGRYAFSHSDFELPVCFTMIERRPTPMSPR